jgi:hypothetical protein
VGEDEVEAVDVGQHGEAGIEDTVFRGVSGVDELTHHAESEVTAIAVSHICRTSKPYECIALGLAIDGALVVHRTLDFPAKVGARPAVGIGIGVGVGIGIGIGIGIGVRRAPGIIGVTEGIGSARV